MRILHPSENTHRCSTEAREPNTSAFSLQPSAFSLSRSERAFTMIEIAIAVGVIGFALVAIIGILPQGMNVQKDNREDTIISQDAPYFLNAIRNGEMRTNNGTLINYVESITRSNVNNGVNIIYINTNLINGGFPYLIDDKTIVGLLSFPEYDFRHTNASGIMITNEMTAIVRAMSGSALQQNGANIATAFRYQLTVEIDPWNSIAPDSTAYGNYPSNSPDWITRSNRSLEVPFLTSSLHEIRLKFAWPVFPNGKIGEGRQTYRSVISSHLGETTNALGTPLWFFEPRLYTTNTSTLNL